MLYYYYKYFLWGDILAAGKTHDKITVIMTPFIASFFLFINMIFLEDLGSSLAFTILGLSVYMFGGYMFSGDLDIKSREFRRWGYLKFIWIPYQKLFEHRSVFTHGFILGPIIRILYVSIIPITISSLLYSFSIINISTPEMLKLVFNFILKNKILFGNMALALFLGSGLHTITDMIYSYFKRKFSYKKRKSSKKYSRSKRPARRAA